MKDIQTENERHTDREKQTYRLRTNRHTEREQTENNYAYRQRIIGKEREREQYRIKIETQIARESKRERETVKEQLLKVLLKSQKADPFANPPCPLPYLTAELYDKKTKTNRPQERNRK